MVWHAVYHVVLFLENTELLCQAIGDEVGYHDIYFFSKIFKKAIGVPSAIYRRREKK